MRRAMMSRKCCRCLICSASSRERGAGCSLSHLPANQSGVAGYIAAGCFLACAGERAVNRGDARKIRCQVAPRAHICAWKGRILSSYQKCQIICQIVGDCFFHLPKKIKMLIWFRELLEMLSSPIGQCWMSLDQGTNWSSRLLRTGK